MGSSCSSGQKKKDKESPPLEVHRRSSARSVDSLPYGKSSPPTSRCHTAASGDTAKKKEVPPPVEIKSVVQSPESKADGTVDSVSTPGSAATIPPLSTTSSTSKARDILNISPSNVYDMRDFPDLVQSLIHGRVIDFKENLKPPVQEITIYICADYKETEAERCALMERTFPVLRQFCANRGYELNVIDLHWAVAGDCLDDHSFGGMCLDTLKNLKSRGKLILMVILHDNPEPPLLPQEIVEEDFEAALHQISSNEDKELFHKWYVRDENAVPASYILQAISEYLPSIASELQEERQKAIDQWRDESRRMILALKEAFSDQMRKKYLTPILEEEIELVVLVDPALIKRTLWLQRKYTQLPEDGIPEDTEKSLIDSNDKNRLTMLKDKLNEMVPESQRLIFPITWNPDVPFLSSRDDEESVQYLDDLCETVEEVLQKMIESLIEEDVTAQAHQPLLGIEQQLYSELVQQHSACQYHLQWFLGREELLDAVKEYVMGTSSSPLIIHGATGSGKTALVVKAAEQCTQWNANASILIRLVGVTPTSSTMDQLLRSLSEQLCLLFGEHPSFGSKALLNSKAILTSLISKASASNPVVLIIDGLDQVASYSGQDLSWVPMRLPEHMKLILTFRDGSTGLSKFKETEDSTIQFLTVPCLTPDESLTIMKATLGKQNRDLTDAQWRLVVLCLHDSPSPLYSHLLAHVSCQWHSSKGPDELDVKRTVEGLILRILSFMEGYMGAQVLAFLLGLLVVAKHGLSDAEILDILSCEEDVLDRTFSHGKAGVRRFPYSVWARVKSNLSFLLKTCVVRGRILTSWRHDIFRDLCFHYLEKNNTPACPKALVDYFEGSWAEGRKKPSTGKEGSLDRFVLSQPLTYSHCPNHRKLTELPYLCLQDNEEAKSLYIFDAEWLYYKFWGCDPLQFIEDIRVHQSRDFSENEELDLLKTITLLSDYALRYDGTQFFAQFQGRLQNLMLDELYADKFPSIKKLYIEACKPPFFSFLTSPLCLTEPYANNRHANDEKSISFTRLFCIKDDDRYVIALSPNRGEIVVWDIYEHCAVRTLMGVIQPREVKMIDRYRALVLCNRELKVYNLDEGRLLTKLKGVMNQKMAYYGIHGENYVVALSRNRMYVNMMNLLTGDLETTFKVGEDRFLNSLLVSSNGRICVCGDETQKPFPLLVWDLANRKLLYDLRIPHHEFITRLSAISDDGHYVASVCRELHDGSPNFIIVYDLQSGTLFKKWKPESNTCSIAVSSQGGCVVDGLENALVVIWDLSTGARRFTLRGHTAPVDSIKLAEFGTRCLTHDSTGKDRSLRLWDISKGECLAVFTPDHPICCCELLQSGNAVVAAMKGIPGIVTLSLCQGKSIEESEPTFDHYGDSERRGGTFDVSQEGCHPMWK